MKYLLDTCVISELLRKKPEPRVIGWLSEQEERSLFLSILTLGELEKGIFKIPDGPLRRQLRNWIDLDLRKRFQDRILPVDGDVADRWGSLSGEAERKGEKVPVIDGLLAATALTHGLTLVTRDIEHATPTTAIIFNPWL
ncbi:MAG TPA: type II toxin-antitoxin system VapC family toxin [Proteobacteria bacterium]|nr:type II toxin-antitoxin system VapC family toxin [Pseudomonadota bacterium]